MKTYSEFWDGVCLGDLQGAVDVSEDWGRINANHPGGYVYAIIDEGERVHIAVDPWARGRCWYWLHDRSMDEWVSVGGDAEFLFYT